ncbi:MAG: hypothetical protein WA139_00310 [Candidatus Aenigmatarchaeota archaeon]
MNENTKWEFIENEIWILTFGGAFQRSKSYEDDTPEDKKTKFREAIKQYIRDIVEKYYRNGIDEKQHMKNIEELCNWASREYGKILNGGRLRIGVGQKILNLYLKYLWCLNKFASPPHCPIDRRIIIKIDNKSAVNWTELDNISVYEDLIKKAKKKANPKSLAEWELDEWGRK